VKKEYNECRVQVRLPNNSNLTHVFSADDKLEALVDFVKQTISVNFQLVTNFPKKAYGPEDYQKTFRELQLVPASAFILKM